MEGCSLPYRVFSKDQRVSHAAVVENKRLGQALAFVKAQQDRKHETKVMTNSEKPGYKKTPRQVYGPDFKPKTKSGAAVEMTLEIALERRFHTFPPHGCYWGLH